MQYVVGCVACNIIVMFADQCHGLVDSVQIRFQGM